MTHDPDCADGATPVPSRSDARIEPTIRWLRQTLESQSGAVDGKRILIAGSDIHVQLFALAIARDLARRGPGILLLDTSQGASTVSSLVRLARAPGLAELCQGAADFDAVIQRDPDSRCHLIASGRPRAVGGPWGKPGSADQVLRALDESYEAVVFCAELEEAQGLADNMKRQFAAAILIEDQRLRKQSFLGDPFSRHSFPVFRLSV